MPTDGDELLLVLELPMNMDADGEERRLAHLLPPLARSPSPPPPFRPPPPRSAAASAEPRISFRGWLGAPRHWDLWVAKLRPIHERLWRDLGILDAVLASTYRFKRDASAVLHLASFWSPQTSTFAFPWGEATLTLQDVAVLGGFPADGSPVPSPLPPHWRPDETALNEVRLGFNRSACKKAHHAAWMKHFLTDTQAGAHMEHAAFLALWLTRFALPGHPESSMRQSIFPLAVRLAHGERVALGPAVLASLYRDLREMKAYLVAAGATGGNAELLSSLSVHAPLYILQLWMWERFPTLWDGKANPIKDGEPRAARWHDVSKKMNPTVICEVLNSGKSFLWQPYTSSVQAWKQHGGWVHGSDVAMNKELRSLAYCLRACELVGTDCIEQYLPHRVAMQFGLDQDVPGDIRRANEDWRVAWETYDLEGQNVCLFIPQSEPGITARYAQWWRQPLPPSDLDVSAASIAVGGKASKRKVKKTPAAMEAEEERERKMKKARISLNSDKKRKLEELYDAKLSDWPAAGRNGSSGSAGSSCKRASSPKSDMESDKPLFDSVETNEDDTVLLVPRKHAITPAVNLKKDKDINPAVGDKGNFKATPLVGMKDKCVNLKGYMTGDVDHPTNQPYFKDKKAVIAIEISTSIEDAKGECNDMDLQNSKELVSGETPDVPNSPEEAKPPVPMGKEEFSNCWSDVDCSNDARKEIVTLDKFPDISSEAGATLILEEKRFNLPEDKCLDIKDGPEEDITVMLELENGASLAVDESCGVSNRPEEVTAPTLEEKEGKGDVVVADEANAVAEGVGRAAEGTSCSFEVVLGTEQEVDAGIMKYPCDAVALPEEILPVQHANYVGGCIEIPCIMEYSNVDAGVLGTNDGEISCDFVSEGQMEVSCVKETGVGERSQMIEKDGKQNSQEAPQVDIVECGKDIILMEKDNEGEHEKVLQTVAEVVTTNNMAAVLFVFPEAENADMGKALKLAKKDTEDMHTEFVEVEGAEREQINNLANEGTKEKHKEVAEAGRIDMADPKMHPQFDIEKPEDAAEIRHAEMDEGKRLTGRDTHLSPEDLSDVEHSEAEKTCELIGNDNGEKLAKVSYVAHTEMETVHGLMKEDTDKNFEEVSEIRNTGTDGPHGPMEKDTDGKLKEVSDVVHAEMQEVKDLVTKDTYPEFEVVSGLENTDMDETHLPMWEDTDGKLKEVPEVNAQVEQANGLEGDNDRPDGSLQVDPPERNKARWLVEDDTIDNTTKVFQVKHDKMRDDVTIEKATKDKLNADDKDLSVKKIYESKEVLQVEQAEGEECMVLREKGTEGNAKDALGVKQAEERQGKAPTARYMHDYVEEITLVEQVDGQSEMFTRLVVEDNAEENTQAQGKEFNEDMMKSSKNSIDRTSASIQSTEEQKEVFVEEKQCIQNVELINERESSSDGATVKVGVDGYKTLDMQEEVAMKQIQDCGIICDNNEQILENSRMIYSGSKSDLVIMEVDETQCTGGIQNLETSDLDKQQKMEERQDLGLIIASNKMIMSRDVNLLGCSQFQTNSPGAKANEIESIKGMQNQEQVSGKLQNLETSDFDKQQKMEERQDLGLIIASNKMIMSRDVNLLGCSQFQTSSPGAKANEIESIKGMQNQEQVLGKRLECETTDGNERPLEVTRALGVGLVDTIVDAGDVNKANSVEGIQNQEACSTDELQVREDRQHHGVGDVTEKGILEETTIDSGKFKSDATGVGGDGAESSEGTQNRSAVSMEKEPTVQEKQDEGVADENTKRSLVDIDEPEFGGVRHDETRKVTHETLPTIKAVNTAGDKNPSKNQQEGVLWLDHSISEKDPAVQEMRDKEMANEDTNRILVDTDAPECGGVAPDGIMKMDHHTLCTVQPVNLAGGIISSNNQQKSLGDHNKLDGEYSKSNQTARKESEGSLQPELVHQVGVKEEILENRTELSIGRENDEASEHDQISTEDANAPSSTDHPGENNNEWAEEPVKIYGKYASGPVNKVCQTSKFGRSSIEEVRRIHSARSVYLKDIKEAQGRIRSEPSNRAQINNVGYYSGHGVQEPVSVSKDIKVPLHDNARICGRDRAPELVTGPPEETSRWRQEQYALNILEDVQNARSAEKTRMEMQIRILKAQIASMQKQVMNLDHVGVTSRSKRY